MVGTSSTGHSPIRRQLDQNKLTGIPWAHLTPRQVSILKLIFVPLSLGSSQTTVARFLGCSEERVQLLVKELRRDLAEYNTTT